MHHMVWKKDDRIVVNIVKLCKSFFAPKFFSVELQILAFKRNKNLRSVRKVKHNLFGGHASAYRGLPAPLLRLSETVVCETIRTP